MRKAHSRCSIKAVAGAYRPAGDRGCLWTWPLAGLREVPTPRPALGGLCRPPGQHGIQLGGPLHDLGLGVRLLPWGLEGSGPGEEGPADGRPGLSGRRSPQGPCPLTHSRCPRGQASLPKGPGHPPLRVQSAAGPAGDPVALPVGDAGRCPGASEPPGRSGAPPSKCGGHLWVGRGQRGWPDTQAHGPPSEPAESLSRSGEVALVTWPQSPGHPLGSPVKGS